MRTSVRIERVVLDGLELSRRERDALGPAIARELRRLASEPANGPAERRAGAQREGRQGQGSVVDGIARDAAAAVHRATAAARPAPGPAARRGYG